MGLSRRTFLAGTAGAGALFAFSGVFKAVAASRPQLSAEQYSALCVRWGDIITGRNLLKEGDERFAKAIAGLDRKVEKTLADLIREPNRTSVFKSFDLTEEKSPAITKTARGALDLALGWATPGSKYYQNEDVLQDAINALRDFLKLRYHPGQEEYGNWWDWESGASRAVGDMMCLLHDKLPSDVMQAAAAGVNFFVPDPWFLRTSKAAGSDSKAGDKTLATGANRLDLSRAVICVALATQNPERVYHALEGLPETWKLVTEGDGFYKDGSFIQHNTIPYTGSYGDVLISGLAMLFSLVSHSAFEVPAKQLAQVYWTVDEAFIPVIVDGQVLDCVRGRSVSRITEPASMHGASIMKAILQLAQGAPEKISKRWKSICKGWIERNNYDPLATKGSIPYLALVGDVLASGESAPASKTPKMFNSMDRLVHRTGSWAMAIAMCSKRIAWYECGNQENELASRTGSGMRYLYLPDDMGQFENGFWPTLDYAAPVGTTVDTHPLERQAAGEWGHETPDNLWTGGVTYNGFSFAGMDLIGPDKDGLHARRVWFGSPEGMLEMVSDVSTQAEQALTVVEGRNLGEKSDKAWVIDGEKVQEEKTLNAPKWAHLDGVGGYVFLQSGQVKAQVAERTGSWIEINPARKAAGAEDKLTRQWASMHFLHDKKGSPAAWLLLPQASLADTEKHAKSSKFSVVQNDAKAQVAKHGNLTAWAVWEKGQYGELSFEQPAIALCDKTAEGLQLLLSDPTQNAEQISVSVKGKWKVANNERVKAQQNGDVTVLNVDTKALAGQAVAVQLRKA
ncbi:polysaccharide lyase 8 family protein [Pasteurellaceae bacterium HPA106]|uniref:polysaccharide lyase 8 family protein n=1 Tax=Spirabiliibacterium pneumoniae TaxID=221400 RepID=UPI001AACCAFA|nr:polysaccharide lyase 8 family protein [Spirabiliibacterium pneumoniae]MBE2896063.1 polysaccharide lyase 8 family protein [Spirabiliibacterium pneumoniae]